MSAPISLVCVHVCAYPETSHSEISSSASFRSFPGVIPRERETLGNMMSSNSAVEDLDSSGLQNMFVGRQG